MVRSYFVYWRFWYMISSESGHRFWSKRRKNSILFSIWRCFPVVLHEMEGALLTECKHNLQIVFTLGTFWYYPKKTCISADQLAENISLLEWRLPRQHRLWVQCTQDNLLGKKRKVHIKVFCGETESELLQYSSVNQGQIIV